MLMSSANELRLILKLSVGRKSLYIRLYDRYSIWNILNLPVRYLYQYVQDAGT